VSNWHRLLSFLNLYRQDKIYSPVIYGGGSRLDIVEIVVVAYYGIDFCSVRSHSVKDLSAFSLSSLD
jgi:hypothetical protein